MIRGRPVAVISLAVALTALTCLARPAGAHDAARSESTIRVAGSREIEVALVLNLLDFGGLADLDRNRDLTFSYDEIDRGIDRLWALVREHFEVGGPDPPEAVTLDRYEMVDATAIRLTFTCRFAADVVAVRVRSTIGAVTQPEHVHVATLDDAGGRRQAALAGDAREVTFALARGVSFDRLLRIAIAIVALLSLVVYAVVRRAYLS